MIEQIHGYVCRVLDALDIRFGITHTELMLTASGPRIIETHVRAAGDEIPSLIRDSLGIDPLGYLVERAAGLPIAERLRTHMAEARPRQRAAAIWYAHTQVYGKLLEVHGLEDAWSVSGVKAVQLLLDPGTKLDGLTSSYSRIAFVRTVAEDAGKALRMAQEATRCMDLRVNVRSGLGADALEPCSGSDSGISNGRVSCCCCRFC